MNCAVRLTISCLVSLLGLPRWWLNEQASTYVVPGGGPTASRVFDHPGLRVFAAFPEHLLAMKAFAARPRDAEDIRQLAKVLGLNSADESSHRSVGSSRTRTGQNDCASCWTTSSRTRTATGMEQEPESRSAAVPPASDDIRAAQTKAEERIQRRPLSLGGRQPDRHLTGGYETVLCLSQLPYPAPVP